MLFLFFGPYPKTIKVGQRQREERSGVVCDGALHGEATVGTNREGHEGSLTRWRILERLESNRKAGRGEMVVLIGGPLQKNLQEVLRAGPPRTAKWFLT
jgi:hypothetical protein